MMNVRLSPLCSIIIPTYNYGRYLARALDSVYVQAGHDVEVVVVDDGSTDDTRSIIERYQAAKRPLMYVHQENRGLAASRNVGVSVSKGEFLLFLDADDGLRPTALAAIRSAVDRDRQADFAVGGWVRVSGTGAIRHIPPPTLRSEPVANFRAFIKSDTLHILNGNCVVRRSVFDRLRFPESVRIWEDRVFYGQLLALYRGAAIQEPIVTVYRHANSLSGNIDLMQRDGFKTVDLLFDPEILPRACMAWRNRYMAVTQGVLCDALYFAEQYREGIVAYHELARLAPFRALAPRMLKRYLKMRWACR